MKKQQNKWLVYLSPLLVIILWLLVYRVLIPFLYGKVVSTIEWFIANPWEIVNALKDSSTFTTPVVVVVLIQLFNWVMFIAFIASLFFVGRLLQTDQGKQNAGAMLADNQPHIIAIGLLEELKMVGNAENARQAMYSLCEKLKNESAFGYGSDAVINCENEISANLNAISDLIPKLRNEATAAEAAQNIEMRCQRCMAKLKVRTELKKK